MLKDTGQDFLPRPSRVLTSVLSSLTLDPELVPVVPPQLVTPVLVPLLVETTRRRKTTVSIVKVSVFRFALNISASANWRVLSCLLEKEEEEDEDIDMGGMFGDDDY